MIVLNNLSSNIFKYNIQKLIEYTLKELGVSENVNITILNNDSLLKKLSGETEFQAFINQTALNNMFIITIKTGVSCPDLIICHELVHLKQYLDKSLHVDIKNKTFTWRGREYSNTYNYVSRPWEVEAVNLSGKILRKFKKELRKSL